MGITVRSVYKKAFKGNYSQVGKLDVQRPFNLELDDFMLAAVTVSPRAFDRTQNEGRFYYPATPEGWRYVSSVTTQDSELFVFYKVAANEPPSYTFNITQDIRGVPLDADPLSVLVGIVTYQGVDANKPINALRTSDFVSERLQVVTTRQNCRIVLASLAIGSDPDVNADSYREWVGVQTDSAHLQIADDTLSAAGASGVESITSTGRVSRVMLALKPQLAQDGEALEVAPPLQGSGAGLYERTPTRVLGLNAYRLEGGVLTPEEEPVRPVAIDVTYNAIGACTGGSMQFVQNPLWRPYSRVLELFYSPRIDQVLQPPVRYYACLVGLPQQDVNPEKIKQNVLGLYQIVKGQPIGTDSTPALPPVFSEATVLFAGSPVSITPNSKDVWQTWGQFLDKLTSSHPTCHYGVGRDRRYIQGRPQDGNAVVINARAPVVTNINPSEYVVNDYATHYYLPPDGDSDPVTVFGVRSDLDDLTPRKTVQTDTDGSGSPVLPNGFNVTPYEIGSYTLRIKGLVIPPALITNLPGGVSQYAAGSRFVVSGGQAYSEIHTQALPNRR